MRHLFRETKQVLFLLALNPLSSIFLQDKKVRSMLSRHVAGIVCVAILKSDLTGGLIVKLDDLLILFDEVHKGEFVAMAFKLDRTSHFY